MGNKTKIADIKSNPKDLNVSNFYQISKEGFEFIENCMLKINIGEQPKSQGFFGTFMIRIFTNKKIDKEIRITKIESAIYFFKELEKCCQEGKEFDKKEKILDEIGDIIYTLGGRKD